MRTFIGLKTPMLLLSLVSLASLLSVESVAAEAVKEADPQGNTLVPAGVSRYQPTIFPDRIILIPTATPALSQTVNWRTQLLQAPLVAEIAPAGDGPALHLAAKRFTANSRQIQTDNGPSAHHQLTFSDLQPDTLYAYRVQGLGTWSEWLQFRTAKTNFAPFRAIYFGDAQNSLKSHFSRVARAALLKAPDAALMIHAGDLVNSRYGVLDNEWGEWFDAAGWQAGMVNQLIVAGNHEYLKLNEDTPQERRVLSPQFSAQFGVVQNGPQPLRDTVYFTDYQGVRFIALNSTEALENEAMAKLQAEWLEQVLSNNPQRWTVVSYHHPMFSVSQGRDNPRLRQYWQPLFAKYGVDLALQGHDHVYGRNVASGVSQAHAGTVYLVSVAGPKMYLVADPARRAMQKVAEDTQLFQLLDFEQDVLRYQSMTVSGQQYDSFELQRQPDGSKRLLETAPSKLLPQRRCGNPDTTTLANKKCWEGDDFGLASKANR
ncbi:purple acid phosphatase family protein [Rheinheimera sp. SA_1]|uniref:purple acid phosphatase family protein n=1 Tax=Rheinheimera sp. SA_1 TaxID=1827365 RepID=UPI0009EDC89A|nr:metallophosphoesterase family protein [Rheinheimera sp. SA_1]